MGVEGIGNNILKFRKKKGVTQEVLAEFIGVTKTSVCKWETGATLPDIQMLPLLASYFEVSIDELVEYVPVLSRQQIRFHYQRLAEAFATKPFGEVLAECGEMSRKYYSCYPFLQQMVILLINHLGAADTDQNREAAMKMALDLCGHILADCQETLICKNTVSLKGTLNLMRGRADLVLEEIGEEALRPEGMEDMGMLLTMAWQMNGEPDRAKRAAQIGMYRSLMSMVEYGIFLLGMEEKEPGQIRMVLKRMDGVMKIFNIQELNPNEAAKYEYQAAAYLAGTLAGRTMDRKAKEDKGMEIDRRTKLEKETKSEAEDVQSLEEEIFRRLESYGTACRQLFADGIELHGDTFFYCLDDWFEEQELGTAGVRSSGSVRESVLQGFQNPVFAVLKDQERLQELARQCEKDIRPIGGRDF